MPVRTPHPFGSMAIVLPIWLGAFSWLPEEPCCCCASVGATRCTWLWRGDVYFVLMCRTHAALAANHTFSIEQFPSERTELLEAFKFARRMAAKPKHRLGGPRRAHHDFGSPRPRAKKPEWISE